MKIIQLILVPALITFTLLYFRSFRSLLFDRLIVISLGFVATLLVIFPEISVKAAQWLGVGRGADLLIYLSLVGILFIYLMLFSKIRQLEERLTHLARSHAIENSDIPSKKNAQRGLEKDQK